MTTTDLASARRSVARKAPANAHTGRKRKRRSKYDPSRTIDGQIIARRGGWTGARMAGVLVCLFLLLGMTGLMAAMLTPTV
jgi:hypothetical protein